jgi:hypothetical protein
VAELETVVVLADRVIRADVRIIDVFRVLGELGELRVLGEFGELRVLGTLGELGLLGYPLNAVLGRTRSCRLSRARSSG